MDPLAIAIIAALVGVVATVSLNMMFKISVAAVKAVPKGAQLIQKRYNGRSFIILRPKRSGKTSYVNYIQNDEFADEVPVKETLEVENIPFFTIDKSANIKLDINKGWDIPGDLSPEGQVAAVKKRRPDSMIVFLSLEDPTYIEQWFTEFTARLNTLLLNDISMASNTNSRSKV